MSNTAAIYPTAEQKPCSHFNDRPEGMQVSLLVIHCISLPEGVYGGKQIEQLFGGCLDCSEHETFTDLQGLEVSAHCVIRRDGHVEQYVPFNKRAWHAGISRFDGVDGCNDYSIGIELEGTDKSAYSHEQYVALKALTQYLQRHYPNITKQRIAAHSDIAPGRKTDPGEQFDWPRYLNSLD